MEFFGFGVMIPMVNTRAGKDALGGHVMEMAQVPASSGEGTVRYWDFFCLSSF